MALAAVSSSSLLLTAAAPAGPSPSQQQRQQAQCRSNGFSSLSQSLLPWAHAQSAAAAVCPRDLGGKGRLLLSTLRASAAPSPSSSAFATAASSATVAEPAADVEGGDNPLLGSDPLPRFDAIKAEHVVPGMKKLLADVEEQLSELEKSVQPTWAGLVEPLEKMSDRLSVMWGAVNHLKSVRDSEALRKAVEEIQPGVVALSLRLGQSKPLYDAFRAIQDGPLWETLNEAQRRVVEAEVESAKASGVALEGEEKKRFNEIQQELAQLSTKFANNVLDATKAFSRLVTDPKEIEGLPPTARSLAAQQAAAKGHEGATSDEGPWLLTLDIPSYMPVLQHCANRALREEMYRAYITRASDGDLDNAPIIERTLALRKEKAKLLGFESHAELVMRRRMATLTAAEKLIDDIRDAAWDASVKELDELKAFAKERAAAEAEDLKNWDVPYWAERLREAKFELKEEDLRPYFSFPTVIDGLFKLANRLFSVEIEPADGDAPVWHPDVRFFRVKDLSGGTMAYFYLDPYSRPAEKRGGAWMDSVCGRSRLLAPEGTEVRLPVAHMVCNQTPPVGDEPSLMTFREVETLFHEFGHALQHMLTKQDEGMVAGISNVEWDAVELPSQFMENWCYHRDTLMGIARHYKTGEELPEEMYQKLLAARTFRAASMAMRQLHFAGLDLELHSRFDPSTDGKESVFDADRRVASRMLVMPPLPEDRFLCAFSHIFAGGYAAGYYGYKWAEVLSADAFSAFEEAGLNDEKAVKNVGERFRETVLGLGGGKPAKEVFIEFRGREPSIEPLLRHNGLVPAGATA